MKKETLNSDSKKLIYIKKILESKQVDEAEAYLASMIRDNSTG